MSVTALDLPVGWEVKIDASSGKPYFVDHTTRKSHWTLPGVFSPPSLPSQEPEEKSRAAVALPLGWEEKFDANSGRPYYVDHINKTSSWEFPASAGLDISVRTAAKPSAANKISISPEQSPRPSATTCVASNLPPQWEIQRDSHGRIYYINHEKKISQWEPPSPSEPGLFQEPDIVCQAEDSESVHQQMSNNAEAISRASFHSSHSAKQAFVSDPLSTTLSTSSTISNLTVQSTGYSGVGHSLVDCPSSTSSSPADGSIIMHPKKARTSFPPYDTIDKVVVEYVYQGKTFLFGGSGLGKQGGGGPAASAVKAISSGWKSLVKSGGTPQNHAQNTPIVDADCPVNVSINSYRISADQMRWFRSEFNIQFKSNHNYWYDSQSGFFGRIGKPTSCNIDPCIPVLGELHSLSSVGSDGPASGVVINGRCLDPVELQDFHNNDMENIVEGQRYAICPAGWVRVETGALAQSPVLYNWRQCQRNAKLRRLQQRVTRRVQIRKPQPAHRYYECSVDTVDSTLVSRNRSDFGGQGASLSSAKANPGGRRPGTRQRSTQSRVAVRDGAPAPRANRSNAPMYAQYQHPMTFGGFWQTDKEEKEEAGLTVELTFGSEKDDKGSSKVDDSESQDKEDEDDEESGENEDKEDDEEKRSRGESSRLRDEDEERLSENEDQEHCEEYAEGDGCYEEENLHDEDEEGLSEEEDQEHCEEYEEGDGNYEEEDFDSEQEEDECSYEEDCGDEY
jgi:WW domain